MAADEVETDIVVRRRPDVGRIVVSGDVDQPGALRLSRTLAALVAEWPYRVEVDLSSATFFCSSGVTALARARAISKDRVYLVASAPAVDKMLRLAGMTTALTPTEA